MEEGSDGVDVVAEVVVVGGFEQEWKGRVLVGDVVRREGDRKRDGLLPKRFDHIDY